VGISVFSAGFFEGCLQYTDEMSRNGRELAVAAAIVESPAARRLPRNLIAAVGPGAWWLRRSGLRRRGGVTVCSLGRQDKVLCLWLCVYELSGWWW